MERSYPAKRADTSAPSQPEPLKPTSKKWNKDFVM